jgi:uncharacterized protein
MATLIVKCTTRCNSNCIYCEAIHAKHVCKDMSLQLLEMVFARIDEYLRAGSERTVTFTWHGGEPLLLGADYYRAARDVQDRLCADTKPRIRHCMQSNLTLLNEQFIAPLKQLGLTSFGSSYGPELHVRGFGANRDSIAYNRALFRGAAIAERNGMGWGFIYVVTKQSLADPIGLFNLLANLRPGQSFSMNPVIVTDERNRDLAITPAEYADFLGALFPYWLRHRDRFSEVQPFESYYQNIVHGKRHLGCVDSGQCHGHHLNIDPDGGLSQCGRSEERGIMNWGSIIDTSIDEALARGREAMSGRVDVLRDGECRGCGAFSICHGGCPIDSFLSWSDYAHKSHWCETRKRFLKQYFLPAVGVEMAV